MHQSRKAPPPTNISSLPTEIPTKANWLSWAEFWLLHLGCGLALDKPLGPWLHKPHRIWEWYYLEDEDEDEDVLINVDYEETVKYVKAGHHGTTRSRRLQYRCSSEAADLDVQNGLPCSVRIKDNMLVMLLNTGPAQVEQAPVTHTFCSC